MTDKPKAFPALGLEINTKELKGAWLSYKQGAPCLDKLFAIQLDAKESTPLHVKPLYMKDEEKTLQTITQTSLVVTAIPTSDVLVRPLSIQLTKNKDIDAVLEFQAEPLLPYPPR